MTNYTVSETTTVFGSLWPADFPGPAPNATIYGWQVTTV